MEAAKKQQNQHLPLYFTEVRANRAKTRTSQKRKKCGKRIVFYSPRRDSVNSKGAPVELQKCNYHCILQVQMRILCVGKFSTKNCDVCLPLRFTIQNAMFQNRKDPFRTRNAKVSKPSRLCIKVTCSMSKGRNEEANTGKLAKTFNNN